jgi:predicted PurR-regulated permease PerM
MSTLLQSQRRAFVIFLVALFILLLFVLKPFFLSFMVGGVLVIVFYPVYEYFLRFTRGRPYVSSLMATLGVTFFLLIPGALIASLVASQLFGVTDQVVQWVNSGQFYDLMKKWNLNLQHDISLIEKTFRIEVNVKALAANAVKQVAFYMYQYSPGVLAQTMSFFVHAFIMIVVVFFLFVEGKGLYKEAILISPMKDAHENALALEMRNMINAVVRGSFATAVIQGILAGIIFYFLDIQGYFVWGALTFLFSFIPIIGAAGVWVPAAIILFLVGETKSGIILTLYGVFVISMVDNLLKPLLMGGKNRVHPLLLFLSIMGGISLAGPVGILLGPITVAVFLAALKIYKQDYLPTVEGRMTNVK